MDNDGMQNGGRLKTLTLGSQFHRENRVPKKGEVFFLGKRKNCGARLPFALSANGWKRSKF